MIGATPLFFLEREGVLEIAVHGEVAVVDGRGLMESSGEARGRYPARSLLKPFQFLASGVAGSALSARHTAALGSISATREQVAQLQAWYAGEEGKKLVAALEVPPSWPMDEAHRAELKARGASPAREWHTCYSKHLAIVEGCLRHGWETSGYLTTAHPFHAKLMSLLTTMLGTDLRSAVCVTDGCGLPSPVLSTVQLAELYRRLAAGKPGSAEAAVRDAMLASPHWIGGPGRVDTRLMEANPGRVIAKEGADGLLGVGILPSPRYPEGLGIVVKIAAGFLPELAGIALTPYLERYGLTGVARVPRGQQAVYPARALGKEPSALRDISPLIDESIAVWPGDVPFTREVSLCTDAGSHLTLSSFRSSVHVGAHTDAPNHTAARSIGIAEADLRRYAGPCQVVAVDVGRGDVIRPAHLGQTEILASRVLFRTGSYPDPRRFNEDFVALSAELVQWLAERRVSLVGIDTPSIDPFPSKTMDAHRATNAAGMAVLEGIVLDGIPDGIYELLALPLKLKDADASPVRAALRPLGAEGPL